MLWFTYNKSVMRYNYGLVERPGFTKWRVRHPPTFILWGIMKELSIFIDESGDFGQYDYHAPYYIISKEKKDKNNFVFIFFVVYVTFPPFHTC